MSRFFRGGPGFAKPENALKRADELIAVGQKGAALRALHDVLSSKRHRAAWTKVLESVGLRYVELCVDLRKGRYAKDGLIHYRNVCQQVGREGEEREREIERLEREVSPTGNVGRRTSPIDAISRKQRKDFCLFLEKCVCVLSAAPLDCVSWIRCVREERRKRARKNPLKGRV